MNANEICARLGERHRCFHDALGREQYNPVNLRTVLHTAAIFSTAASLLSGCSGAPLSSTVGTPPIVANGSPDGARYRAVSGVKRSAATRVLYVSDAKYLNQINVLQYGTWTQLPPVTTGVNNPAGIWVGKNHNLYVANYSGPTITEYDPSGNLVNTYSNGMKEPVGVTTDSLGNIYETDFKGYVNEYAEGSDSVIGHCSPGGEAMVAGVAVDRHGNVFIDYSQYGDGQGYLGEYKHGLSGSRCIESVFPVTFAGLGGIVFDRTGNIIACVVGGAGSSAVDIVARPFTAITGSLGSNWSGPNFATVDRAGTQVYVSDPPAGTITVFSYPSGSIITKLGSSNGVFEPDSAVDSNNYVP